MRSRSLALFLAATLGVGRGVSAEPQGINLETALRLAGSQSLTLEIARERVREARSVVEQERQAVFPWLAPGVGYRRHDGNLQDVVGDVFDVSKQSAAAALTVRAQLDLGDSLYRVLAARQTVRAVEADEAVRRRDTLTAAAAGYLELSRAEASRTVAEDAVQVTEELLRQVRQAVGAGVAFAGEIPRAEGQRERNLALRLVADENTRLASVRLAQILRLPAATELRPELAEFLPVVWVPTNRSLDSLVTAAWQSRPERRRSEAQLAAVQARREGVTKGPWIPILGAEAAFGGLIGGRNGDFRNGDDYQEYGLGLSWRLGPGGLGDRARVRTATSRLHLAELGREQERDEITREVIEAQIRAQTLAQRLDVAGRALAAAQKLLDLTRARREFGVGAVLEAIEAERELTRSRLDQVGTLADHNRAQWELWRVTGIESLPVGAPK